MEEDRKKVGRSLRYTLYFIGLIWLIKLIEIGFNIDLSEFGILPRTVHGSVGIFLAPFIHGDFYHLMSNSVPILLLGSFLFYFYYRIAFKVILLIYLTTGIWVWVAARDAYHIGASGIVYGLITFLLFSGFLRKDRSSLAISFIILLLYGGTFFMGVLPQDPSISWESHLMGAVAGILCAFYFRTDLVSDSKTHIVIEQPTYEYEYKEDSKNTGSTYQYTLDVTKRDSNKNTS